MSREGKGDWRKDLEFGKEAERDFMSFYPEPLIYSTNLKWDFTTVKDGHRVELKTDDWDADKTQNFFFERWSDVHKETPGGPWRARKHGVHRFCYYFIRNGIYFEGSPKALCKAADKHIKEKKLGLIYVKNRAWVTGGFKIPREVFKDIMKEVKK